MQLLHDPVQATQWLRHHASGHLQVDSRRVSPGDAFIAWPGFATDGRRHVADARARGAACCLVEREGVADFDFSGEDIAAYEGLKAATGRIAARFYDEPSHGLDVVAVTGTNGKTSTAWWVAQALTALPVPRRCAVIGTLGVGMPPDVQATGLTTPDPVLLQRTFRDISEAGGVACAIEASSIGIAERRLDGTRIRVAVFTNFTQDHLDYHGDMSTYWQAKAELFRWPGLRAAVINVDDAQGATLADQLVSGLEVWTVSARGAARLMARDIEVTSAGLRFQVVEGASSRALQTTLTGHYNVSNLLGVIGALRALGVALDEAVESCGALSAVPGRMQRVPGAAHQPLVVVDYAHTPDALDKVLAGLRPAAQARGGQLWCVFGCGGDRDPVKRPMMAAVAEAGADVVVVTSDNPRGERPEAIVSQILLGFSRPDVAQVEVDRARAIAGVIREADARDVILLAGKGHEAYQEIAGQRHPFSDVDQARDALAARSDA